MSQPLSPKTETSGRRLLFNLAFLNIFDLQARERGVLPAPPIHLGAVAMAMSTFRSISGRRQEQSMTPIKR